MNGHDDPEGRADHSADDGADRGADDADLLLAAFLAAPPALDAWQRWRSAVDWDGHLDPDRYALLPFAYRNVTDLGGDDPLFLRVRGIRRKSWLENQHRFTTFGPVIDACAAEAVAPIVLPPLARLLADPALPTRDHEPLHLAVPPCAAVPVLRSLLARGWAGAQVVLPRRSLAGYVAGTDGVELQRTEQTTSARVRLSWSLERWFEDDAPRVWADVLPGTLGGRAVAALDPTDAVEVLLRESVAEPWFAPLAAVLTAAVLRPPDWTGIAERARRRPFPPSWADAFHAARPVLDGWGVEADTASWCRTPAARPALLDGREPAGPWKRAAAALEPVLGGPAGRTATAIALPGYLQARWAIARPRRLAPVLARALVSRAASGRGRTSSARASGS